LGRRKLHMRANPLLYSFRRCPYAMRARLALLASGVVCEIREVKLSAKPEALRAASPKATVPVLVLPDGEVIDESLDIMRWALRRHDPDKWLAQEDTRLIAANDGPFKHHLDRYKYPERHDTDAAEHQKAALALVKELETRLSGQSNLCGNAPGLTDIAIMPFIRQFAQTDRPWFDAQPLPGVQAWLARHTGSPMFGAAMVRLPFWQPQDEIRLFPAALGQDLGTPRKT